MTNEYTCTHIKNSLTQMFKNCYSIILILTLTSCTCNSKPLCDNVQCISCHSLWGKSSAEYSITERVAASSLTPEGLNRLLYRKEKNCHNNVYML